MFPPIVLKNVSFSSEVASEMAFLNAAIEEGTKTVPGISLTAIANIRQRSLNSDALMPSIRGSNDLEAERGGGEGLLPGDNAHFHTEFYLTGDKVRNLPLIPHI